jgi:hypothetical protein
MQRSIVPLVATLLIGAPPATAFTLFEDFSHGEVVTAVGADNFNRDFDYAVAFDTNRSGTEDPDLERGSGWSAGNLAPSTDVGKILILQENNAGCATGICSSPDDEGDRPAGTFGFQLGGGTATSLSLYLIDVEEDEGAATRGGAITFFLADTGAPPTITINFAHFLTLGQGVEFGDHSANRVDLVLDRPFHSFLIRMGGSGGIDNLLVNGQPIPEPAAAQLLGLGLSAFAIARRLRRR